jgi:hypothetical protein
MSARRSLKLILFVAALALVPLSFFFYRPPAYYFFITCLATVMVWGAVFSLKPGKRLGGTLVGQAVLLAIQQLAFHHWRAEQTSAWWALAQCLAIQYLVAFRRKDSSDDPSQPSIAARDRQAD